MQRFIYKEECYKIIGAAMEVHRALGQGFLEAVYQEALAMELNALNIPFRREVSLPIFYKNQQMEKSYIADFICFDNIIVELKGVSSITEAHQAQILNYLKATNSPLGLLINFGGSSLQYKRYLPKH
ncbi:GxxExxY protein [Persicobacter diffluens]|uniref:GxxExxY protein n=1 Tax=Persicobacter diffluens TaxID=981 RepID=A0AAN4VWW8_9BACT|nr:hypothetical protein PEDI_20730 [Persicobacter diffluens]